MQLLHTYLCDIESTATLVLCVKIIIIISACLHRKAKEEDCTVEDIETEGMHIAQSL